MNFQEAMAMVDTFCREYWYAGPILLALVTIGGGIWNRSKRNAIAAESALKLRQQAEAHALELNRVTAQRQQEAAHTDPNRILTPAEKVCKLLRTAIGFGADDWNLEPGDTRKMTCTRTGFDKVNLKFDKANKVTIYVGTEDVTATCAAETGTTYGSSHQQITALATALLNAKVVRLEELRLARIAGEFEQPVAAAKTGPVVAGVPQPNGELSAVDREFATELYNQVVRVLTPSRFVGPVQQDCNQMSDNSSVVIKSYGPDDAEVWISGTTVMGFFNDAQRLAVARQVYTIVSGIRDRRAYLDNALAALKKIA